MTLNYIVGGVLCTKESFHWAFSFKVFWKVLLNLYDVTRFNNFLLTQQEKKTEEKQLHTNYVWIHMYVPHVPKLAKKLGNQVPQSSKLWTSCYPSLSFMKISKFNLGYLSEEKKNMPIF